MGTAIPRVFNFSPGTNQCPLQMTANHSREPHCQLRKMEEVGVLVNQGHLMLSKPEDIEVKITASSLIIKLFSSDQNFLQ